MEDKKGKKVFHLCIARTITKYVFNYKLRLRRADNDLKTSLEMIS